MSTLRVAACVIIPMVSKSTVHKDVTVLLKQIDTVLFDKVRRVLDANLAERHIRGGLATKRKWHS